MASQKILRALRQPVLAAMLIAAVALAGVLAVPAARTHIAAQLDNSANLFLFDGELEPGPDGKQPNGFKRAIGAPFRLVARLFKRKPGDAAMKKTNDKDAAKIKIVPLNRSQNGTADQLADASNTITKEASTTEAAAQNLFEEAVTLHDKGRTDGAIEKLAAAVVLQSNFAEAFNLLAVCYDEKGQYKSAQEEYKHALKIEPNNARFLNNLGYSYYLAGDNNSAVKWYGKGLKVTPNDRRMHNNIGLAYGRKGDYDKAKEHFRVAVGEVGMNLNLGYIHSQQGKIDEAIKYYEIALYMQPNSLPALSNLAQLYERTGRLSDAAHLNQQYKKLSVNAQQKEQAAGQEQEDER